MKKLSSLALALLYGTAAAAEHKIDAAHLLRHIKALASDEFEGRAPATRGEAITITYLQDELKKLGLAPGNPDGSYLQKVPLVYVQPSPTLVYTAAGKPVPLNFPADYVAWTPRVERKVSVANSDLVFVGYGVHAPEFKWDDYKGMDLRGKTLVMPVSYTHLTLPTKA